MGAFDDLLEVQQHDTHLDQLAHRRDNLPERAELGADRRAADVVASTVVRLEAERDELLKAQKRIEDDVALVEAKGKEVNDNLYSGSVTSPKELQALQDEIEAMRRRQGQLEDQILELMERLEPVTEGLGAARDEAVSSTAAVEASAVRLTTAEAEVEVELADATAARAASASGIAAEVLEDYETLRGQLGGIAVARLEAGVCSGCNLGLSAVEVDRIRGLSPDETVHCEECGRLLVH